MMTNRRLGGLLLLLALTGCDLPSEPDEPLPSEPDEPLPSGYVRVCLSLEPTLSDPRDCVGNGHLGGERAPVKQSEINVPLEGIPVRLCFFAAFLQCQNREDGHFIVGTSDSDGYAVFHDLPRPEELIGYGETMLYRVMLDVESVEYEGCTLVVAYASQHGSAVQIAHRVPTTPPEYHNAHITELWMRVDSCE